MTAARVQMVTTNVDFTDGPRGSLANFLDSFPGAGLAFLQEAKKLDLRHELSGLVGVHQAGDTARAGSALVWDRTQLQALGRSWHLGANPVPGWMLARWLTWADLEHRATSFRFRGIAAHAPPRYLGKAPQAEFKANLARFIALSPLPVVVGLDTNQKNPARWAGDLGLGWAGKGVDGFAYSHTLDVGDVRRLKPTGSDHRAVAATLTLGKP